ncbi:MAG: hypothetical protein HY897_21725 [Deltaproteobacteria bacterium]|nr:hypothetical protein [Deltaproteobacteria bacterium]
METEKGTAVRRCLATAVVAVAVVGAGAFIAVREARIARFEVGQFALVDRCLAKPADECERSLHEFQREEEAKIDEIKASRIRALKQHLKEANENGDLARAQRVGPVLWKYTNAGPLPFPKDAIPRSISQTLPVSESPLPLEMFPAGPVVQISPRNILLDGAVVAQLENGKVVAEHKEGGRETSYLIAPLLHALKGGKDGKWTGCWYPAERIFKQLVVAADAETSYRVLTEVLYTVGQAEFGRYLLLGRDRQGRVVVETLGTPVISPYEQQFPIPCFVAVRKDPLRVLVGKSNGKEPATFSLPELPPVPCGRDTPVDLVAEADVGLQDVFRVLDLVNDHTCVPDRRELWIAAGL